MQKGGFKLLKELEGKRISVVVPKQKVVRVQKVLKTGPKTKDKYVWLIDFRGIRNGNAAVKNPKRKYGGTKVAFNSPEKLQLLVNEYFNSCFGFLYDKNGNIKYDEKGDPIRYQRKPFTISGLALGIGVTTKTFNRYCSGQFDNEAFDSDVGTYKEILQNARQRVESYAESRLYDKEGNFGAKFVLDSSFGWCTQREKSEIKERKFNMWIREKEFELKKQLAEMGEDSSGLEIHIVRKEE